MKEYCCITDRQGDVMWSPALTALVIASALACGKTEDKIVEGQWSVQSLMPCPNVEQYRYKLEAKKSKMNRTHDWFHVTINLPEKLNAETHGIYIEMCRKLDGGCKPQYQLGHSSLCNFAKNYSEGNFHSILSSMGVESADCPIPEGEWKLDGYLFDYGDLPKDAVVGSYTATGYVTMGQERVMCIMMDVNFEEPYEDEE